MLSISVTTQLGIQKRLHKCMLKESMTGRKAAFSWD